MKFLLWLAVVLMTGCQAGYVPPGPRYECPALPLHKDLLYPCKCTSGSDAGLYVTCDQTNLASLSVGLANLGSLNYPVEELIISSCNFAHLYGDLLYPLKIRVLRIIDTPIKTIKSFTFLGVNRTLQEVHIINSKLQEFPKQAFNNLGNLSVLNIDGHEITVLSKDMFSMSAAPSQLKQLSVVNGALAQLVPDALMPCNRLRRLDLHNNSLSSLLKGQFRGLRDVDFLDLSFNNITKVDATHMSDVGKLVWFNISHNALTELNRGTFGRNNGLKSLTISHNKLRKLDPNMFKGMRMMRRLYMSDNNIAEVARGTFESLSRIGTIDLARNSIKKIDFQMFNSLPFVEVIDVSENQVGQIFKHAFKELYLVHINLSHNKISYIEKESFVNCANISVLDLSHNRLSSYHLQSAFDENTYATELQLSYNNFTDLSQVPLANMTGLKLLNVSHNNLTEIPRGSVPKLYYLHTVDFSYNRLTTIAAVVFQVVFGLRTLLFQHNELEELTYGTLGSLPTLLHLDLSHNRAYFQTQFILRQSSLRTLGLKNLLCRDELPEGRFLEAKESTINMSFINFHVKLSRLHKEAMMRLPSVRTMVIHHNNISEMFDIPQSLSHVDLSYNSLTFETPHKWPSMNSLLSLNLSNNYLGDNLVLESFTNLLTLQSLDLSFNGITLPPKQALLALPSLQKLNLESNEISELERQSFGLLPVVSELNLANNQIEALIDQTFLGLKQLTVLNLSSNNISTVTTSAFKDLVAVRTLDLSSNKIEALDNKTNSIFEDLLSLERLNLRWNKISFVTRKSFPSSQWVPYQLKHLDLSYNEMPVLSYELTFGTKSLLSLNLSHNNIDEIRKSVIGNLTSLRELDLSYNNIADLTATGVFLLPTNLSFLDLSHNRLFVFPVEPILRAHNLRHLDLRHNQLEEFYSKLMPAIRNGTLIYYDGNAISCDCQLRPVRRWALSLSYTDPAWSQYHCEDPEEVDTMPLLQVPEELMICNTSETTELLDKDEYQLTPDVKFRQLSKLEEGGVRASWYVNTKHDVADFKLIVRNTSTSDLGESKKLLWEKLEHYNTRSDSFFTLPKNKEGLELCVLAVTSEGYTMPPLPSQCALLVARNSAASYIPQLLLIFAFSVLTFTLFL